MPYSDEVGGYYAGNNVWFMPTPDALNGSWFVVPAFMDENGLPATDTKEFEGFDPMSYKDKQGACDRAAREERMYRKSHT